MKRIESYLNVTLYKWKQIGYIWKKIRREYAYGCLFKWPLQAGHSFSALKFIMDKTMLKLVNANAGYSN